MVQQGAACQIAACSGKWPFLLHFRLYTLQQIDIIIEPFVIVIRSSERSEQSLLEVELNCDTDFELPAPKTWFARACQLP